MREPGTHGHGACAGFTLIEALLVLLIIGSVTGLALPAIWGRSPRLRLEADTGRVVSALRLTRAAAIRRNEEAGVFVDTARRTVSSTLGANTQLDREIEIGMTYASQEWSKPGVGGIRFFPNGQSSGGEIRLQLGAVQSRVLVNWATGHADIDR